MKAKRNKSFVTALLILVMAGFSAALVLLNLNRMTWLETEIYDGAQLLPQAGGKPAVIALPDNLEIIQTIWVGQKKDLPQPEGIALLDPDGNVIRELVPITIVDREGDDWWQFRISDRERIRQKKGNLLRFVFPEETLALQGGVLKAEVYGGTRDPFWLVWTALVCAVECLFLIRWIWVLRRGDSPLSDMVIRAFLVMLVSFVMMLIFASPHNFENIDEYDNMIGGMVLTAQHKVIYRDYITQHTPFAYWLCAFYALTGANSPEQFRLLFNLTCAAVLGWLYYRHRDSESRRTGVMLLAFLWGPVGLTTVYDATGTILGDHTLALAMCVLLLEMLAYFEDHRMTAGRCAVVSGTVFVSVMSAFLGVYSLAAAAAAVFAEDILFMIRSRQGWREMLRRYARLVLFVLVPFAAAGIYFACCHALKDAIDLSFRFNTEVYCKYMWGLGTDKLKPVFDAVKNVGSLISERISETAALQLGTRKIPQVILLLLAFFALLKMTVKKRFIPAAGLLAFLVLQAVRDTSWFHSGMFWETLLLFVLTQLPGMHSLRPWKKRAAVLLWTAAIFLPAADPYFYKLSTDFPRRLPAADMHQQEIEDLLEDGEDLYFDSTAMYLAARGHMPVNRLIWNFPWYMDWYQEACVEDLRRAKPRVVMYDPYCIIAKKEKYTPLIHEEIKEHYRLTDLKQVYLRNE